MKEFASTLIVLLANVALLEFTTVGCRRALSAQEQAEQMALQHHEKDVQQQRAAQSMMNMMQQLESKPGGKDTEAAIMFMMKMYQSGLLPGGQNGSLSDHFDVDAASTNYPMSRIFNIRLKSGTNVNHYALLKENAGAVWELKDSWQTDKRGVTNLTTLPLPVQETAPSSQ